MALVPPNGRGKSQTLVDCSEQGRILKRNLTQDLIGKRIQTVY